MTSDAHFSYALSFVGANGLGYTRTVYADRLYVFSTHKGQLLTSMRYVPFNDLLFATYMALRATRDEEDDTSALPSFVEETQSLQLRDDGIIPFAETALSLPPEIEQKAHDLIASTYQKVVADATLGGSLGPAPDLTRMDHAFGERYATPRITYRSPPDWTVGMWGGSLWGTRSSTRSIRPLKTCTGGAANSCLLRAEM